MTRTRAWLAAGMVAGVVVTAGAAQQAVPNDPWCGDERSGNDRVQVCEVREMTVPAGASLLSVNAAPNGGIEVTGTDRGDMRVRAKVVASAATDARAREILAAVRVNIAADKVDAEGPRGLGRREGYSVSYRLEVPTRTSLDLESVNGGIDVSGVDGRIAFKTVNGGIKLAAVAGDVRGETTNGGVDVTLDGPAWQGEGLDIRTSNGGVRLRVPSDYSAQLEAGTVNGGFDIDFPVTVQGRMGREVQATLGAGGPPIKVHTHNGGVKVMRR